jgi:hypothetical protein
VLDFHVELRAAEIVDRVGRAGSKEDVYALVRLAHNLHSSFLWAEICERLRTAWWHDLLNPWKFGDSDVEILGDSIFSLLSILASVSSRPKLFSHLDELCVLYSEGKQTSLWIVCCADKRCRGRRERRRDREEEYAAGLHLRSAIQVGRV